MTIRAEEIFAGLVTLLFAFGDDTELYARQYISSFSVQPRSRQGASADSRVVFLEAVLTVFLVTDPVFMMKMGSETGSDSLRNPWTTRRLTPEEAQARIKSHDVFRECKGRFLRLFQGIAPFYWGCSDEPRANQELALASKYFDELFELSFPIAQAEWQRVHSIYRRFCQAELGGEVSRSLAECRRFVDEYVMSSLKSGEALFETRLLESEGLLESAARKRIEGDGLERCMDELLLCCSVLRGYLKCTLGTMNPELEMHLRRDDEGRRPTGGANCKTDQGGFSEFPKMGINPSLEKRRAAAGCCS
jgi:hypothetical protein